MSDESGLIVVQNIFVEMVGTVGSNIRSVMESKLEKEKAVSIELATSI